MFSFESSTSVTFILGYDFRDIFLLSLRLCKTNDMLRLRVSGVTEKNNTLFLISCFSLSAVAS